MSNEQKKPEDKPFEAAADKKLADEKKTKDSPEKVDLVKQITDTLNQYGGHESDIPVNHPYWTWVNQNRGLK